MYTYKMVAFYAASETNTKHGLKIMYNKYILYLRALKKMKDVIVL